jgi:membrane protein implicated in regulation of membrane protease activity
MQWWAWVAVGAILLGSELTLVSAQFYLVFLGGSALIVGLSNLAGLNAAVWLQWSMFAVLAAVSMIGFRRRVYERLRRELPVVRGGPDGETVVLPAALAPGGTCRLEFRGSSWSACNSGRSVIAAGARARIERIEGLTLMVQADS